MKFNRTILFINSIFLFAFLVSGCASFTKLAVGKRGIEIPQIVAHLEPFLKHNKITVLGRIIIQNPTNGALGLDKIYLEIRDENKTVLEKAVLDWERPVVLSKEELGAPVDINLSLAALNNKSITVFIRTGFTYKKFGLHIPIENRVAVLHLDALKETIARPLYVNIFTKFRSTILGNYSLEFMMGVTNPLSIDLAFEDGEISVCTQEGKDIAKTRLSPALFTGMQLSQIKGAIKIGNIWRNPIRGELLRRRPLKFLLSGRLRIPKTDIFIPFKIESTADISFSVTQM